MSDESGNGNEFTEAKIAEKHTEFTDLTDIGVLRSVETDTLTEELSVISTDFLEGFVEVSLLEESEVAEIAHIFRTAVPLDTSGMEAFIAMRNLPYERAIADLSTEDPDQNNPEAQQMINKARLIIHNNEKYLQESVGFVYRPGAELSVFFGKPVDEAMPPFMVLNASKFDDISEDSALLRMFALEESLHLVSKFKDYGIREKWLEEMAARVVAVEVPEGHSSLPQHDLGRIKEALRYDDYHDLYRVLVAKVGSEEAVIRMFFGKELQDSDAVRKFKSAVVELGMLGSFVDMGVSFKSLRKALNNF